MPFYREIRWVTVNGRWTRFSEITNVESGTEGKAANRTNFLMIPGNPGNEGFYEEFGRQLLSALPVQKDQRLSFYTVSHLNHVPLPVELVKRHLFPERFILSDQVQHKLDFCRQYLPKEGKLYIIGHSIGAYMSLRILQTLVEEGWDVEMCYALFPVVERIADTPNGRKLQARVKFFDRHDLLAKALCLWLNYLPERLRRWLVSWRLPAKTPKCIVDSAAELLHVGVIRNIIHMTNDELQQVGEFDSALIEEKDRILFYYGTTDGWCPLEFADDMEKRLPGKVLRDKERCEHAFVIRDSAVMARVVAQLVQNPPGVTDFEYIERDEKELSEQMPLIGEMSA